MLWRISSTITLKKATTSYLCSLESDHVWWGKFKDGCLWKWACWCWRSLYTAVQNVAARREADYFPHFLNKCSNQHNCWRWRRYLLTSVLRPDPYMQLLQMFGSLITFSCSWNNMSVSVWISINFEDDSVIWIPCPGSKWNRHMWERWFLYSRLSPASRNGLHKQS